MKNYKFKNGFQNDAEGGAITISLRAIQKPMLSFIMWKYSWNFGANWFEIIHEFLASSFSNFQSFFRPFFDLCSSATLCRTRLDNS